MAVAVFGTSESLVTVRGRSFRRYVYNHEWDAHVVCDGLRSGAMWR